MKVRNGFVSNSSTTSFCIYGTCISAGYRYLDTWELKDKGIIEEEPKLYLHHTEDGLYIGNQWAQVGDDETGRQFKERTEAEVHAFLSLLASKGVIDVEQTQNLKFGTEEYCAYDG